MMRISDAQDVLEQSKKLAERGQVNDALELCKTLPPAAAKSQLMAQLLLSRGRRTDVSRAQKILRRWQKNSPASVDPIFQLMELYWQTGRFHLAPKLAQRALRIERRHVYVDYYLAVALHLAGNLKAALPNYRKSIIKNLHEKVGELELDIEIAIQVYDTAAGRFPGSLFPNEELLVNAEEEYKMLHAALEAWRCGGPDYAKLSPGQVTRFGDAYYNLGCADMARFNCYKRAAQHFESALKINPDHLLALSNGLFALNYDKNLSTESIARTHLLGGRTMRASLGRPLTRFHNVAKTDKKLRIAYLSSDFHKHSVAYFITPVIEAHNRDQCEVYTYYNGRQKDEWTERIMMATDRVRLVALLDDEALHKQIVDDRIDILVDLSGHTKGNRAGVLMRRAAPVQLSWLGYPNTTGMDVMDYRIVDQVSEPESTNDKLYCERLIRMPKVFSVYLPENDLPPVAIQTPAFKQGYITFGSFNYMTKLNPELLELWAQILGQVENSRLLVKNQMISQATVRRDLLQAVQKAGIDSARVEFKGRTESSYDHFEDYGCVDICLDTYPYNGTTTTCDSLIMGVPVITLAGSSHPSRVSASLLATVGLQQLVASSPDQYVEIATQLASDLVVLNSLRSGLREDMRSSPLMDYPEFTRHLEHEYRIIWRHWCEHGCTKPRLC